MTPSLWQRIIGRAGQALWRVKGSILVGVIVLGVAGAYAFLYVPTQSSAGAPGGGRRRQGLRRYGHVRAGGLEHRPAGLPVHGYVVPAAGLAATVRGATGGQLDHGPITKLSRVGTYDSPAGSTLVYYAVDTNNEQSLGFIVYLGPEREGADHRVTRLRQRAIVFRA